MSGHALLTIGVTVGGGGPTMTRAGGEAEMAMDEPTPFAHWLKAVGLPSHFPRLDAVEFPVDATGAPTAEFDDRFYFGQPHEELIEEAIQSLAQPALANLIPDGHGITTLARYVYRRSAAEASLRSLIPVSIVLEDVIEEADIEKVEAAFGIKAPTGLLAGQRYFRLLRLAAALPRSSEERERAAAMLFEPVTVTVLQDAIDSAIQDALVRSLVSEPWERILGRSYYAELVGADTAASEDLERTRRNLLVVLGDRGQSAELFESFGTRLNEEWTVLMPELQRQSNVRLSLQLDLSPSPIGRVYDQAGGEVLLPSYVSAIANASAAVKNIDQRAEHVAKERDLPMLAERSYLHHVYFLSDLAWTAFEAHVNERIEQTEFPAYSLLDAFTILAVHFPRKTAGKKDRQDDLATVLDSNTIPHKDDKALSTMMEDLSVWLTSLKMIDVRFQLTHAWAGIWGTARALEDLEEWRTRIDAEVKRLQAEVERLRGGGGA